MIEMKELILKDAYKEQGFAVTKYVEEDDVYLLFDVEVENTFVKGYGLYLMFEDESGEYVLDDILPNAFFTKAQLKDFEKVIFSNEVKTEIFNQKKAAGKK